MVRRWDAAERVWREVKMEVVDQSPRADPDGPELVPMQPVRDVLKEMEAAIDRDIRDGYLRRALRFT